MMTPSSILRRSPYPHAAIPGRPLAEYVFEHAALYSDKPAVIEGPSGKVLTYAGLVDAIRRAAAGLSERGFSKGDACAIYSHNIPDYIIAFYGAALVGGVVTTINPLYNVAELTHQLRDSNASLLIAASHLLPTATRGAEQAGITDVLTFGDSAGPGSFLTLLETDPGAPGGDIDTTQDIVALPYSSGTTGLPKGVMLTHHNIVANLVQIEAVEQLDSTEVVIATLPFYHIYGMVVVMGMALHAGATLVTMPRFEVKMFLQAIERYRVTTAYLVPPIVRTLAKHPLVDQYDLSSLRDVQSGAASLPEAIARLCAERHGCIVRQAYGLTETSSVTHLSPRDRVRLNSVGLALPNTECRVVDVAHRRDVQPGELGEVWVRGPQVMKGYLNNPEATRGMIDEEGWLYTGDIGHVDQDGYLYVADRAKELVKFRGLQYGENELLIAMVEDAAARKQASTRVAFQALLLDSVHESVVATDVAGNVISWNKGAEDLFGYRAEEAMGQPLDQLILPPEDDIRAARNLALVELSRNGEWKGQVVRQRRDGARLWTDVVVSSVTDHDGRPCGRIAIHRDITEQKAVESRLRIQAQLLDSVRESVVAIDFQGHVVFWGKGAEALFGYGADEVLGHALPSLILFLPDAGTDWIARIRDEVAHKGTWRAELPQRRKDGSAFYAEISVAAVRDTDERPVGLIAIHRDITELRQNQEMLQDSREQLRNLASSLMAVREQERSALSRELHDQLGQSLTRLKIDLCWLTNRIPKYLFTRRAQSMVSLVDQTIELVQHISGQLRPAILDDLGLEAALEWQAQEFAEWNRCRCAVDLRLGRLVPHADRDTAVFRIVQEALTNVARHAQAQMVTVRGRVVRSSLVLKIEDDGVGIPKHKLAGSDSLGFIGMRERAAGLNGRIDFSPRRPRGTVVCIRVPLQDTRS